MVGNVGIYNNKNNIMNYYDATPQVIYPSLF